MARMGLTLLSALLVIALGAADDTITLKYKEVIDYIKEKSDADVIPIDENDPRPVKVTVKVSVVYVVTVDVDAEVVELISRQTLTWQDPTLKWSKSKFDVDNVTIPLSHIWSPDISPLNSVSIQEELSRENAIVSYDGEVTYSPQIRTGIHADLTGLGSASGAKVTFSYESWGHDQSQFRFENPTDESFSLDEFESKKYYASNTMVEKSSRWHPSRPSMHDSLEFTFILKKKN